MLSDRLAEIVGKENVSAGEEARIVYAYDASVLEGEARLVVWPRDGEQITRIVARAIEEGFDLVPRGGGTGLAGGAVPQGSVVLDLSKMDRILAIDEQEKFAVVEPGVILQALNRQLQRRGLLFPVIPSSHRVCTIGGMIATDAAGTRAIRFGKTADWIEELEIIDGQARSIKAAKQDAQRCCGTEGTLGIITEAKLKLIEPLPQTSLSLSKFDDPKELVARVIELKRRKDIMAIEFIDGEASRLAGLGDGLHLLVEYEGPKGEIREEAEIGRTWRMRDGAYPALASHGFSIIEDPQLPLEQAPELLRWLEERKIPSFGHIGIGIIHPCFSRERQGEIEEMLKLVEGLGGEVSGEHGIGLRKKRWVDEAFIEEMQRLKEEYDPYSILNRGKLC
ncbi:MAG: FAD-binding oxidoreductase [Candidatus Bipolaricaulia bacterium]